MTTELRYHLAFQDWAAFTHHVQLTMKSYRRVHAFSRFGVTAAYVFCAVLAWQMKQDWMVASALGLLAIAWVILFPAVQRRRTHRQLQRMEKDGAAKGILGDYHLTATDEGLIAELDGNRSEFLWSSFSGVDTDGDRHFLMLSPNRALVIPPKVEGIEAFLQAFHDRVSAP